MIDSTLFDLLEQSYFMQLREKWERQNAEMEDDLQRQKQELCAMLPPEQEKTLKIYGANIENKCEEMSHDLVVHALNLGIQIGMELQTAFAEEK